MKNTSSNFAAMVSEAEDFNLPSTFKSDLYEHDAKVVNDDGDYLWVLYESGTHLWRFDGSDGNLNALNTMTTCEGYWGDPDLFHVYYVADGECVELTPAEARAFAVEYREVA